VAVAATIAITHWSDILAQTSLIQAKYLGFGGF